MVAIMVARGDGIGPEIITPQGGGYKSINVTMRKTLGLYANIRPVRSYHPIRSGHKELVGLDLFLDWQTENGRDPDELAAALSKINGDELQLVMITNRGQKVWPERHPETFCTDHWRCRFQTPGEGPLPGAAITHAQIVSLLERAHAAGLDFIKIENLYRFDGELGFSLGQGQT
jgi:isocitrate dehydrogenase